MEEDYPSYVRGTRDLRTHIYAEDYSPEIAAVRAPKVIYMASCLLDNQLYYRNISIEELVKETITHERLKPLKYLKKVNIEGYAYTIMADKIISKIQ